MQQANLHDTPALHSRVVAHVLASCFALSTARLRHTEASVLSCIDSPNHAWSTAGVPAVAAALGEAADAHGHQPHQESGFGHSQATSWHSARSASLTELMKT